MSHLHLSPAAVDLLTVLFHRPAADPSSPTLPAGSRTATALTRAVQAWRTTRREAENALLAHLREVHAVALRSFSHDAATAHQLREMMR